MYDCRILKNIKTLTRKETNFFTEFDIIIEIFNDCLCRKAWPFVRHLEAQFGRILSEAVLAAPKLEKDAQLKL